MKKMLKWLLLCAVYTGLGHKAIAHNHSTYLSIVFYSCDSLPVTLVSYAVFGDTTQGYGYDIMVNGALLIRQRFIPCIKGMKGFSSKRDASMVAALVVEKVKKGIMPPGVTIREMNGLKIEMH
ncbi:MAG: DUF4907 domain-containing protein [Flavisolibacter sp.]